MKVSQRNWAEVFGEGNMFAISPVSTFQKVNSVSFHPFNHKYIENFFCAIKLTTCIEELNSSGNTDMYFYVIYRTENS